jgi:hypothetical protein
MDNRQTTQTQSTSCSYFVDEAGDGTLFDPKGRVIIGTPGCSRYFILGLLEIPEPATLSSALNDLRHRLLNDPYFKDVPSMQPKYKKTALAFHAKDDLPEIRREVLSFLQTQDSLKFYAVVRDKQSVLEYVRQRNTKEPSYRYNANELYDFMVRRLFQDRLNQHDEYDVYFAKRGNSDRTEALKTALETARKRFLEKWQKSDPAPGIKVTPTTPKINPGIQAADYFTWSLQRFYERGEDRFVNYLWPMYRLVIDIDDTRQAGYGTYYTKKKPLTRAALEGRNK